MHRDQLPIPEPCHASWGAMSGDTKKRFCGSCTKHVHDLSALTAPQAAEVLATEEGPCVRYTVGADGEIVHVAPSRWPRLVAIGAALLGATPALASGIAVPEATASEETLVARVLRRAQEVLVGSPTEPEMGQVQVMGEIEAPPPPPPPRPVLMGRPRMPTPVIPLPPKPPEPPVRSPIPTPAPGETVIPEVEEALRRR